MCCGCVYTTILKPHSASTDCSYVANAMPRPRPKKIVDDFVLSTTNNHVLSSRNTIDCDHISFHIDTTYQKGALDVVVCPYHIEPTPLEGVGIVATHPLFYWKHTQERVCHVSPVALEKNSPT